MSTPVQLTFTGLANPYCFEGDFSQLGQDIIGATQASIGGTFNVFVFGPAVPQITDRDKIWFKTTGAGVLDPHNPYVWNPVEGHWVTPHPLGIGSIERRIVIGDPLTLDNLITFYDGGDNAPPDNCHGAMWTIDSAYNTRMPVGGGTAGFPVNFPSGLALQVNSTGGEEKHFLDPNELPPHVHPTLTAGGKFLIVTPGANSTTPSPGGANFPEDDTTGDNVTTNLAHNNEPLYIANIFLKRSNRIYYRGD